MDFHNDKKQFLLQWRRYHILTVIITLQQRRKSFLCLLYNVRKIGIIFFSLYLYIYIYIYIYIIYNICNICIYTLYCIYIYCILCSMFWIYILQSWHGHDFGLYFLIAFLKFLKDLILFRCEDVVCHILGSRHFRHSKPWFTVFTFGIINCDFLKLHVS